MEILLTVLVFLVLIAGLALILSRRRGAPGTHDAKTHVEDQRRLREIRTETPWTKGTGSD
jgi:hypothetical protein